MTKQRDLKCYRKFQTFAGDSVRELATDKAENRPDGLLTDLSERAANSKRPRRHF